MVYTKIIAMKLDLAKEQSTAVGFDLRRGQDQPYNICPPDTSRR